MSVHPCSQPNAVSHLIVFSLVWIFFNNLDRKKNLLIAGSSELVGIQSNHFIWFVVFHFLVYYEFYFISRSKTILHICICVWFTQHGMLYLIGHMAWGVNRCDMIIILTFDSNMTWSVVTWHGQWSHDMGSGHITWAVVTWHGQWSHDMGSGHMTWSVVTWHGQWSHDMGSGHMTWAVVTWHWHFIDFFFRLRFKYLVSHDMGSLNMTWFYWFFS